MLLFVNTLHLSNCSNKVQMKLNTNPVCLFVWSFSSQSRIFHSFGDDHCRWTAAHFDVCSVLISVEQWGFFNVPHLLWNGASVYNGHLQWPVALTTLCRAFGSGAVTSCFNDLGLSQLGFEHPTFRMWGERSYQLRHRSGPIQCETEEIIKFIC